MIEAPRCSNELERLYALHSYKILDTEPDPAFDSLVELAARLLKVNMALITLIDVERQWFKARIGCEVQETPRGLSFCAHALLDPSSLLVVPDARLDPRFSGHPEVGKPDGICFYAGAPLVDREGYALGTLCVVDSVPRTLTSSEYSDLKMLAQHVVDRLELHRSHHRLQETYAAEKRTAQELAEAARVKSIFYATLTHEIRSPLTGIIGYAELLQDPELDAAKITRSAQSILSSSRHLLHVVNDLLDLSKAEAGHLAIENVVVDIQKLLEEVEQFALIKCEAKGLELKVTQSRTVPTAVHSDPLRLRQVLFNLLSNGIKFTHAGSIKVDVNYLGGDLSFSISDSGIGLSPEQINSIFEPFSQAELSTSRKYGGTGLGLSICKNIAETFGGSISVVSTVGKGTTFTFTVPAPRVESEPEEVLESKTRPPIHGRVLVAEDCSVNREMIRYLLEKEGLEVATVGDGYAAVTAACSNHFDLILMDLHMPLCSGVDAVDTIRRSGIQVPIVALTASTAETDRLALFKAGCDDAVPKPFDRVTLLSKVAHYLGSEVSVEVGEDDPKLQQIISGFLSKIPERVFQLEKQLELESWNELKHSAHVLAGAGLFGFHPLGSSAKKLESAAASGEASAIREALEALHHEAHLVLRSARARAL